MLKNVLHVTSVCAITAVICTASYALSFNHENPKKAYANAIDISEKPPISDDFCIEIHTEEESNDDVLLDEVPIVEQPVEETEPVEKKPVEEEETNFIGLTESEIDLLALLTMAEAEGEPEQGKRLVIDTVLNRVDSSEFPDTVHGVIYQKGQFSSMFDGRVEECYVMDSIRQLVIEEAQNRTNYECLWFRTGRYSSYGDPLFKVGHHYFSK